MSVAWITSDLHGPYWNRTPGGCAYYRCYLPMSVSGQHGHMGEEAWSYMHGFGIKDKNITGVFGYKTVVLKLVMHRWITRQIELAQKLGQRIIVDIDDHYEALTEANKAFYETHPDQNPNKNRDHYYQSILAADAVTVSTPLLYDVWSARRDNVHLIRNGVNPDQFHPRKHTPGKPTIGWVGATSYRNNDLEQLREWLPDLVEKYDLAVHHSGHSPDSPSFADITGLDPLRVTTSPLLPIDRYASGFTFDIGLVPLSNIPFNEAKSNIKGLEYAAAGIPFIASDLPEYRSLHESGVGRIAQQSSDWSEHVVSLLNPAARRTEAARARTIVSDQWSIYSRASEWQTVLKSTS